MSLDNRAHLNGFLNESKYANHIGDTIPVKYANQIGDSYLGFLRHQLIDLNVLILKYLLIRIMLRIKGITVANEIYVMLSQTSRYADSNTNRKLRGCPTRVTPGSDI